MTDINLNLIALTGKKSPGALKYSWEVYCQPATVTNLCIGYLTHDHLWSVYKRTHAVYDNWLSIKTLATFEDALEHIEGMLKAQALLNEPLKGIT